MCHSRLQGSCSGCRHAVTRRGFLRGLGATAAASMALPSMPAPAGEGSGGKVRVAAVFLANMDVREIWPYPGFDAQGRQREILAELEKGCPQVEFLPMTIAKPDEVRKAAGLKDQVDGYLVYVLTLDWALGKPIIEIAKLGKPMILADEFLGGCGVFLTSFSELCRLGLPVAGVSSTRLADLVTVVRQFAKVREPGTTPTSFARQCDEVYRRTFAKSGTGACLDDSVALTGIGECVQRLKASRFLIVGAGKAGQEQEFLGAKGIHIGFDELKGFYEKVDREQATEWATRWSRQAQRVVEPKLDPIREAAAVYLATLELLKKHGCDSVTMNCLGGFNAGNLPGYPCLGFMQILNDGGQGVCEAMPDDTVSMLMARILTGRPGYVSDPALDTSKNQIVYAHCVATTKAFGPKGESNPFRIRTLHNRDPRGACGESMLPAGYMTTSFRTHWAQKKMVIHQAKAVGSLDSECGCRTKLIGEVRGEIARLFRQWSQFSWHRVTVYGDVKGPLIEFGKALGLEVVEEA